jgi:methylmalonyl-CoA mutase cobalamin-binding subunit
VHDLTSVIHVHSTYSDGTGTVQQIARAAARAGVDVVLLTDHDSLEAKRRGEEGWHGATLVLVGEEVTPSDRDHFLAFGIDEEISRRMSGPEICDAVRAAGGFGFAAHPFSLGSERFKRPGIAFGELDCLDGIELWSFLNDTGERVRGYRDLARMIFRPQSMIGGPPERNLREWDRLSRSRRVVAVGGLDAHQFGIRVAGHVPLRAMSYKRTFKQLHTHVLCRRPVTHELEHDRALVYEALRAGSAYIAVDALAPARGFAFWVTRRDGEIVPMGAEAPFEAGMTAHVRVPRSAHIRLVHEGRVTADSQSDALDYPLDRDGVTRTEVMLRNRAWIVSNPVFLRM